MHFSALWLRAVQLAVSDEQNGTSWSGTGFFMRITIKGTTVDVLITARHVIAFMDDQGFNVATKLSFQWPFLPVGGQNYTDIEMKCRTIEPEFYAEHPTNLSGGIANPLFTLDGRNYDWVDLIGVTLGKQLEGMDERNTWGAATLLDTSQVLLCPGAQLAILGCPNYWPMERRAHALPRTGFLASPPNVLVENYPAYAIDGLTHGGMSGGPVVWNPTSHPEPLVSNPTHLEVRPERLAGVFAASNEETEMSWAIQPVELTRLLSSGGPRTILEMRQSLANAASAPNV